MKEDRFKVSGELFRRVLTHMDLLSRDELMEIQAERREIKPDLCLPAFYHMIIALEDLARVELINRDLIGGSED